MDRGFVYQSRKYPGMESASQLHERYMNLSASAVMIPGLAGSIIPAVTVQLEQCLEDVEMRKDANWRLDIVYEFTYCLATDPRDRVFSTLGFLAATRSDDRKQLRVDCSRTCRRIYRDVFEVCSSQTGDKAYHRVNQQRGPLNIICSSRTDKFSSDLPSRLLDWASISQHDQSVRSISFVQATIQTLYAAFPVTVKHVLRHSVAKHASTKSLFFRLDHVASGNKDRRRFPRRVHFRGICQCLFQ